MIKLEYRRTKDGLLSKIYSSQKATSSRRNHIPPTYSLQELKEWMFSLENFNDIYDEWKQSDYDTKKIPSIDRREDDLPYTLQNIQLTTWEINNSRGCSDRKKGINNKVNKSVSQYTLNNIFIEKFHSIAQASRKVGIATSSIHDICNNKNKSPGKFIWKYS